MSPTYLTTRPAPARSRAPQLVVALLVVVSTLAFVAGVTRATAVAGTVDRVVIQNGTEYGLDVVLRGEADGERLLLGRALPQQATQRLQVIDVGQRWRFAFRSDGEVIGEVEMSRADLAAAMWTVTVPDDIARALDASPREPYPEEGSR